MAELDWLRRRGRIYWYDQYTLNEQATAFAKYDPDRIVDEVCSTGADVVAVYATNQFGVAYYPSTIWPQHPNLRGRDYFGELCERFRSRGLKVIAYTNYLDSKHPEWNLVAPRDLDNPEATSEKPLASWAELSTPHGRVQALTGGNWDLPCYNSPHREDILAIAEEICSRYRPDMFHLDMFFHTYCLCERCRAELRQLFGVESVDIQTIAAHYADYVDWRAGKSASLILALTKIAHGHGVLAAHNGFAPLFFEPVFGLSEKWLPGLDVFLSECFDAFLLPPTDLNATSITVRWQRAIRKPAWILRTGHELGYAHWPLTDVQWDLYAAACKANGCALFGPCGVGARADATTQPNLLAGVKHGFDAYMRDADLAEEAESIAEVGLLFSWATRNYREPHRQWEREFYGWARLLIEDHVPYDIVCTEDLAGLADLDRYRVLVLPDLAHLDDAVCRLLDDYVRGGGRLLATGATSLCQPREGRRTDLALADALGMTHHEELPEADFAFEWNGLHAPAAGFFHRVEAHGEVLSHFVAVDPAGPLSNTHDPLPVEVTAWPVAVRNRYGAGESVYVAFDAGRMYTERGDAHIADWLGGLFDLLLPAPALTVRAPRTVEATLWRQAAKRRTLVHLANRTVPWSLPTRERQIAEIVPVHNIELSLRGAAGSSVSARGAAIEAHEADGALVIRVDKVTDYAAVVIEDP